MSNSSITSTSHLNQGASLEQLATTPELSLPQSYCINAKQQLFATDAIADYDEAMPELVVFSDTSIQQLTQLLVIIEQTQLTLTAINHRAGRTSLRFAIANQVLNKKALLNEFAIEQGIELALIDAAPSLSRPGLLVMDMDSTAIDIECIDQIANLAGVGKEVSEVTERAMQGELDFAQSLRQRVSKLSGAEADILARVGEQLPFMPGLKTLVSTLHQHQWKVAVVSGGFTYFTDILKHQLQLDATQANVLEIVDNKLTGKVLGNITDAQAKADTLRRLATEFAINDRQTVAMGDGANDLLMLNAAHFGVAYKAKPVVLQQASAAINTRGLDTLLHYLK
ncbi:phosphoserine phosphatase SerB [Thalassotalea ponticola]|uniref:phosphoserine phosphatase SerB n=1 Tax=Thalassotalea ponticola TaxID=1523392 RepID=UPI0025B4DE9B|nr:phosphoserine phosphatase SerB [Thalassotalea ponticola]MDN3653851.1 phosphoserine phosphatase SerB [Thalassotalea ponticola]